jgi:hypothetical protein
MTYSGIELGTFGLAVSIPNHYTSGNQSLSLFPSNHRSHAQNVKCNMKFDTFFHDLLTKKDKLGNHCTAPFKTRMQLR